MRYHYEPPNFYTPMYGELYICNHPVYSRCTLFREGDEGFAVIQQRYDPITKTTWWEEIDPWLANDLYLHPKFPEYFSQHAKRPADGLYPTVAIRQIMWAFRMLPLEKERWETVFDRSDI